MHDILHRNDRRKRKGDTIGPNSGRERDSGALWSPEVNCRPPWGSQMCDTVVESSVCVQIASQIQSRVWRHSSERERDSGANLCSPEVNCRPPWGSQKCDTVDEFSVCVQIASRIQSSVWRGSSERERDSGANLWSPEVNCRLPLGSQKCNNVVDFSVCTAPTAVMGARV